MITSRVRVAVVARCAPGSAPRSPRTSTSGSRAMRSASSARRSGRTADLLRQLVRIDRRLREDLHHVERRRARRCSIVRQDLVADPLHDRRHRHHRRHADHDAEDREAERSLFARSASTAMPTFSRSCDRRNRAASFGPQRGDRVEPRRARAPDTRRTARRPPRRAARRAPPTTSVTRAGSGDATRDERGERPAGRRRR